MEFLFEISKHLSQHKVTEIMNKAYGMFLDTVPLIPDVDNNSPWLKNIIGVAYEIGVWQQLEVEGFSLDEISLFTRNALFRITSKMPDSIKTQAADAILSAEYARQISEQSKTLNPVSNWKIEFVEPSPTENFQIGLNIWSCPIVNLCKAKGVEHYASYFCTNDYATYSALGLSLNRKHTLADGYSHCDFRLSSNNNEI